MDKMDESLWRYDQSDSKNIFCKQRVYRLNYTWKVLAACVIIALLSVSYVNCLEITEVESELGTAYLITGYDELLFAFTREQAEAIAASLEEKELLAQDYETLDEYASQLEEALQKCESGATWGRRLLLAAAAVIVAESIWLGVK